MSDPIYPPYNELEDQARVHATINQGNAAASQSASMQYQMEEADKSLAEAQLDCEKTLTDIYHNLKQDVLKLNQDGVLEWTQLKDETKRVLTDEGVEKIMGIMKSYINKETLLSNFDDKQIARRMMDFRFALSGLIFMKYEVYFRSPTLAECKAILMKRILEKINKEIMNAEIMQRNYNKKEIEQKVLKELEPSIDYEIDKIRKVKSAENRNEFEMMFTELSALVEATHNRAWKGEERGSLRRRFNISEVIGGQAKQPEARRFGSWFK